MGHGGILFFVKKKVVQIKKKSTALWDSSLILKKKISSWMRVTIIGFEDESKWDAYFDNTVGSP